jgi:hypothetical protein
VDAPNLFGSALSSANLVASDHRTLSYPVGEGFLRDD